MTVKQLVFFKRTAELGNMTRAAEDLLVSQPFLSRQITELENELEVEFFDRIGRRIELNVCGRAFYQRVIKIFNEFDDAVKEARDLSLSQSKRLTLVTNVSLYMPGLLKLMADSDSELVISQYSSRKSKIEKLLSNGEVDFAICCPPLEPSEHLAAIDLHFEPGVLVYPSGHWLEKRECVGIDEILDETFIAATRGFGTRDVVDAFLQQEKLSLKILVETTDTSSVFKFVEKGLGISFAPYSLVSAEPRFQNNYTKVSAKVGGMVSLAWRHSRYLGGTERLFIEKARTYFAGLKDLD